MMDNSSNDKRALDALKKLERPAASAEARERIRAAFLQAKPERRRSPVRGPLRLVLAAAAVILLYIYGAWPDGSWEVVDVVAPEGIQLGGPTLAKGDAVRGGTIAMGDSSELALQIAGALRIRIRPGTEMSLPDAPKRWFDRKLTIEVAQGEVYGTTGGRKLDFPLILRTGEATCRITGTTFAAFRTEESTCFCLLSGSIEVSPGDGSSTVQVPEEHRVFIYRDGRAPAVVPISDMERMKLSMMHEAGVDPARE